MSIGNKETLYFRAKKLTEHIYGIVNSSVCMFLLVGKHHALLLDTGYGFANLKEYIKQITNLPLYVINSHGHIDHTAGNTAFDGQIYIHPADVEVYHQHNSPEFRRVGLEMIRKSQRLMFWAKWIPKGLKEDIYTNARPVEAFSFVKDGDLFDLGGMTAQVVELPGHTPGSIGLLVKEERLFFVGDAINNNVWMFGPEATKLQIYQRTLQRAWSLDFDYLVTGHSVEPVPKEQLRDYISVAMNLDFEHGRSFSSVLFPGVKARECKEKRNKSKWLWDQNKAGIVISEDKLF